MPASKTRRGKMPRLLRSWLHPLRLGLLGLFPPLLDLIDVRSAQREQLLLVIDHLLAALARQRIIALQEDRLLWTHLLAKAAEDATEHIDVEFLWSFFNIAC